MALNNGFNRNVFGYIRSMNAEKELTEISIELLDDMDNDPDILFIKEAGVNPFTTVDTINEAQEPETELEIVTEEETEEETAEAV